MPDRISVSAFLAEHTSIGVTGKLIIYVLYQPVISNQLSSNFVYLLLSGTNYKQQRRPNRKQSDPGLYHPGAPCACPLGGGYAPVSNAFGGGGGRSVLFPLLCGAHPPQPLDLWRQAVQVSDDSKCITNKCCKGDPVSKLSRPLLHFQESAYRAQASVRYCRAVRCASTMSTKAAQTKCRCQ